MKISFRLLFLGSLFLSFFSCSSADSKEEVLDVLSLSTLSEFSANQETQTVEVTANAYWYTSNNNSWITITPTNGTNNRTIDISVKANSEYNKRTGIITVIGGDLSESLTVTQAAREEASGELDASKAPSQNFDLATWNLSIPENKGNGTAKTITVSEINSEYENSKYFYTADDGGMVFKCPVDGFKTSTGTSYTRVEFREMLRGTNTSIDTKGVNKNNWVFGTAPQADKTAAAAFDGEMSATLSVNHVTTTGDSSQQGRVIVGQIHANDDEPIRLYYRKLKDNPLGSIYFAHEPITGSEQWHEMIGSKDSSTSNPSDGIALDEKFSYNIKVVGDTLTVTITREGKADVVKTVNMLNSGYNNGGQYMYFKAGVYNQNNTGDADDYVQATFYALEKSHTTD
ncbi:polysaccharide lyase family 7 protein [Polaribacter sp. Z014]|uniref:polysaccharide lyase family 7 protein n=1 Tax=Polaribacter sp. Z014 TaxID=2927126 RepID=UPI00202072C5|nr:polysaccharide lyase family 7 protein [Polaribacter sp. Z014]MCL7764851.1 polysaccharide lyase family 7 protein [Polaribacter sp. Z014]